MKTQNDDTNKTKCKLNYAEKNNLFVPEPPISFLSNCNSMHIIFNRTNKK